MTHRCRSVPKRATCWWLFRPNRQRRTIRTATATWVSPWSWGPAAAKCRKRRRLTRRSCCSATWPPTTCRRASSAWALWLVNRPLEALAEVQKALKRNPDSEPLLLAAAEFCGSLGRAQKTLDYDRRVLAKNPWNAGLHGHMAELLARRGQWVEVEKECRAALRCDPTHLEARRYLVLCLLEKDRVDQARAEMDTLLSLKPPNAADLRRWFDRQMEHWQQRHR